MVNDDILLQKNAAVCTSTSDRNWVGDIAKSSRLCWEACRCPGLLYGTVLSQ